MRGWLTLTSSTSLLDEAKSSGFLKKVITHQSAIDLRLFRKTWRTLSCSPKTMKVIREIQENLLCVGKRKELITKKKADSRCWCSRTGAQMNAKHIISCWKRVSGRDQLPPRHRGEHPPQQHPHPEGIGLPRAEVGDEDGEDPPNDEITIGTDHLRSDEGKHGVPFQL